MYYASSCQIYNLKQAFTDYNSVCWQTVVVFKSLTRLLEMLQPNWPSTFTTFY